MATQTYQIRPNSSVSWSVSRDGYTTQTGSFTMPNDDHSITVSLVEDPAQCWAIFSGGGTVEMDTDSFTYSNATSPIVKVETSGNPYRFSFIDDATSLTGVTYIDGTYLTNCSSMFMNCTNLTTVPLFDTSNVNTMTQMFYNCSNLTTIPLFDTSGVVSMTNMFVNCTSLQSIPLLDTSAVSNMNNMFQNCYALSTVPILDTTGVTSMGNMFKNCTSLTSVPALDYSDASVTRIFEGCTGLQTAGNLDFSGATGSAGNGIFNGCTSLTTVGNIDLSNVDYIGNYSGSDSSGIFNECTSLETVGTISCAGVTRLASSTTAGSHNPFYHCTSLKNLGGLSGLGPNLSTSYNHYLILTSCPLTYQSALNVINSVGTAATSSKTKQIRFKNDVYCMLTDADIAIATGKNWTVSAPSTYYARWDGGGTADATIGGTSYTGLSSPISRTTYSQNPMTYITFENNTTITDLNIFGSRNVTSLNSTFSGCTALTHIVSCSGAFIDDVTDAFTGCTSLTDIDGFVNLGLGFTSGHTVDFSDCPLTHDSAVNIINYLATVSLSDCVVKFANSTYDSLTSAEIAVATGKGWTIERATPVSYWATWTGGGTANATIGGTAYTSLSSPILKSSYEGNMTSLSLNSNTDITSLDEADTSHMVSTREMFWSCTNLTSIPDINTSNVTDMRHMFAYCSSLTSVPLFDTSNVTNMYRMFVECSSLTSVPLFDTSNVTDMSLMFDECSSLTSVPLFDTSSVTNMENMFTGCSSLTSVPQFDTSNVTNMIYMFANCVSLTSVPQLDYASTMYGTFQHCTGLTSISQMNTSRATLMYETFKNCYNLTSISQLDTSNVSTMYGLFYGWGDLNSRPTLDCSRADSIGDMFYGCDSLTTIGGLTNLGVAYTSSKRLSLTSCPLTHQSAVNILNSIGTVPSSIASASIAFSLTTYNTLTSAEIAVATAKNWTVTSA